MGEEVAGVWDRLRHDGCRSGWVTAARRRQGGSVRSQRHGWLTGGQRGHGLLPQVGHQGRCHVPVVYQQCKTSGFADNHEWGLARLNPDVCSRSEELGPCSARGMSSCRAQP